MTEQTEQTKQTEQTTPILSTTLSTIHDAVSLATRFHFGQYRKHTIAGMAIPYIVHPLEVMKLVWKWGAGTKAILKASVCHDILEDTNITLDRLKKEIGEEATLIVQELTFELPLFIPEKESKREYMKSFKNKSVNAFVIKIADRILNVLDFALTDLKYAKKYYEKAKDLFDAFYERKEEIKNVFGEHVVKNMESSFNDMLWAVSK